MKCLALSRQIFAYGLCFAAGTLLMCHAHGQGYELAQPEQVASDLAGEVSPSIAYGEMIGPATAAQSSAYPDGDYYRQLSAASGEGGCGGSCDHWGCGGSPYRTGPGRCDNFRVGPIWKISLDGIFMTRDETDLDALAAAVGTTVDTANESQNFQHGAGTRLLVSGWWPQMKGYEMQVGYVGIFNWDANVLPPAVAVAAPPAGSVALTEQRDLKYGSELHAIEINVQQTGDSPWKAYHGVRYLLIDESIYDTIDQFGTAPLGIGDVSITNDAVTLADVENHLIGFQLGVRRDVWQISRKLSLQGFSSGGAYCNLIDRDMYSAQTQTRTEIIAVDDPGTPDFNEIGTTDTTTTSTGTRTKTERAEFAFVGETSVAVVYKINACTALRGGYQALYINGIELADDFYLGRPPETEDLLIHGWFAGFEYRR